MAESFQLEIVTPEKLVVKDSAEEMQLPGKKGYLGILPGHAPLITELAVGQISYRNRDETRYLSVAWGFAEVLPERVTILAEVAERADEIDCDRAKRAKQRAEQRLAAADANVDLERARRALAKATSRLEAAQKAGMASR